MLHYTIIKKYQEVHNRLSIENNIILMETRILVSLTMRKNILQILHSVHQGVSHRSTRAKLSVYWPGIMNDLRNTRYTCKTCNELVPCQPKESIQLSSSPDCPFQQICADYFQLQCHSYLSIINRYTASLNIYHFLQGQSTSQTLINTFRTLFIVYRVPEEISSDGGPQFIAYSFQTFLSAWDIKHCLSSVDYLQSNGRAELGVKSAKRIISDNICKDGYLNNDKAAHAIMQYHNTPLSHINLSPAQLLLHRQL